MEEVRWEPFQARTTDSCAFYLTFNNCSVDAFQFVVFLMVKCIKNLNSLCRIFGYFPLFGKLMVFILVVVAPVYQGKITKIQDTSYNIKSFLVVFNGIRFFYLWFSSSITSDAWGKR